MELKELERRIENKNAEIVKIQKRIDKWTAGLRDQDIEALNKFNTYSEMCSYKRENETQIPKSSDWNKGPNFSEAWSAIRDLKEAKATLEKYNAQKDKEVNYNNENKIEALVNFLNEWGEKAKSWYLRNAKHYFELKVEWEEIEEELEKSFKEHYNNDYWMTKRAMRNEMQDHFNSIANLTVEITSMKRDSITRKYISYTVNTELLDKYIENEKKIKYRDLCERISSKVGEIQDCSNLSIGNQSGELNGIVKGTKGSVRINTISAGGYNIQCFHYRVLVNNI